ALAVDHDAARLMGINVDAVIRVAFVLGAMLAAASGVMLGIYYVQIHFTMGFLLGLRAFTAAVLGGIGNIPGAMVGGLLIDLLERRLRHGGRGFGGDLRHARAQP